MDLAENPLRLAAVAAVLCVTGTVFGQELEPRAYSAAPVGVHFLIMGLGYSSGDVLVDPSLPATDVKARSPMFQPRACRPCRC